MAPTQGWEITEKTPPGDLPLNNATLRAQFEAQVPDNAAYTRPYWSRANEWRDHIYQINTPQYLHLPFAPPELLGVFSYEVEGVRFVLSRPARTVSMDRPWGEQRRFSRRSRRSTSPLRRALESCPSAAQPSVTVAVTVSNNVKGDAAGKVRLRLPDGWTPAEHTFTFTHAGEAQLLFQCLIAARCNRRGLRIHAVAESGGRVYTEGYRVIAHRDLEPRHLYRPATMDVRGIDVQVAPNLSVGYVMGVGDESRKRSNRSV